jgi:hypothetical protein
LRIGASSHLCATFSTASSHRETFIPGCLVQHRRLGRVDFDQGASY